MTTNLFINYYQDGNKERQKELDSCVLENLKVFDKIIVIAGKTDIKYLEELSPIFFKKIIPVITDERPSFDYFFDLMVCFSDMNNLNVIANLDIIIPKETLSKAAKYFTGGLKCLALTRWNMTEGLNVEFYDNEKSQDSWFFNGEALVNIDVPFGLGVPGTDNAIAHILHEQGYEVLNPSLTLKTYHYHLTNIRNYEQEQGVNFPVHVPPPYKHLIPTE